MIAAPLSQVLSDGSSTYLYGHDLPPHPIAAAAASSTILAC
jgi:hypothetical protein